MKKITYLIIGWAVGLSFLFAPIAIYADMRPYVGISTGISNADDSKVTCRANYTPIIGLEFSSENGTTYSIENRHTRSFNHSYRDISLLFKPEYNGIYPLVGIGTTSYIDVDESKTGLRYGGGYSFGEKYNNMFVDIVYDEPMSDYVVSFGIRYKLTAF